MVDIFHGTFKWFVKDKVYGVLSVYNDNKMVGDIFVHQFNIKLQPNKNEEHQRLVTYFLHQKLNKHKDG